MADRHLQQFDETSQKSMWLFEAGLATVGTWRLLRD